MNSKKLYFSKLIWKLKQTHLQKKKIKLDFKDSKYATGRRKKSIARVWLKKGSGLIYVNG